MLARYGKNKYLVDPTRLVPDLDTSSNKYENGWVSAQIALKNLDMTRKEILKRLEYEPYFRIRNNKFVGSTYCIELPSELM